MSYDDWKTGQFDDNSPINRGESEERTIDDVIDSLNCEDSKIVSDEIRYLNAEIKLKRDQLLKQKQEVISLVDELDYLEIDTYTKNKLKQIFNL